MVYYKKVTTTRRKVGKSEVVGIKGLSKEDNFADGQNVVVADYDDFIKILNDSGSNEKELSDENLQLKDEINKLNKKLEEKENEISKKDAKVEELQNNIIDIQEHTYNKESQSYFNTKFIDTFERMDQLRDQVNQRNELLFGAQTNILNTIDDIIYETVEKANKIIAENNQENQLIMNSAIKDIQNQYDQRDLYTSKAIEETVDGLNEELRNISFWKLLRNRKNIELKVDVSELKESIPIDNKKLHTKPNVQISTTDIKKKHKLYDLKPFCIDTTKDDDEDDNKPIDIGN